MKNENLFNSTVNFYNINNENFIEFLSEFYGDILDIKSNDEIHKKLINELFLLYTELNEKGIDEKILKDKIDLFLESNQIIKKIDKLKNDTEEIKTETNNISSQLDTITKNNLKKENVQNSTLSPKPIVVFTFDDGAIQDLTIMKPLFDEFGYKGVSYITTGFTGTTKNNVTYMNERQLLELYKAGWELGGHTENHVQLGQSNEKTIEYELMTCKHKLEKLGIKVNNFAYPFGSNNNLSQRLALKYFKTATLFNANRNRINIPISKEALERKALGSYFDTPTEKFPITDTFEGYYKPWIDDAINNNTMTIFCLHSWAMYENETQMNYLRQTLQYCKDNNVSVMTLNEALEYYDNKLYYRTYNDDNTIKNEFGVDANGQLYATNLTFPINIHYLDAIKINQDTLPKDYPVGYSRLDINDGNKWTIFGGSVIVYTDNVTGRNDIVRQWVHKQGSADIKFRYSLQNGDWSDFINIIDTTQTNKFKLAPFKPVTSSFDLNAGESVEYDIPNSIIKWDSVVVGNTDSTLPTGVVYDVFNNKGLGCKLVITNLSGETKWIPNTTAFIIKEV